MEKDLKELKRALNRSGASTLLSKEFFFWVPAATSAVALEPISAACEPFGGYTGLMGYQDRRRDILREHSSSWPFIVGGSTLPIT